MKKSNFVKFIKTGLLPEGFYNDLKSEVLSYINEIEGKKDSVYIKGINDYELPFHRKDLILLLNRYIQSEILEWELEYIINFIELSFEVEDEKIEEVLFNFSDPYLGYQINQRNIEMTIYFLLNKKCILELNEEKDIKLREEYRSIFS